MQQTGDCNRNETEDGDHKSALRQKKLKAKTLKWKSSNKEMMNNKEEGGGVYDDTVLCSVTTASFKSLIGRKRVRTLGKVAQQCDAIDPPVPRRLRSAINKRVRHVKKRRNLSAISAQISFVDQRTRFGETTLLTEEEEVADALLWLSQTPSTCEFMDDKVIADGTNINVSSTSYSEGATKEINILPNADDELSNRAASIVGRSENVPHVISVPGATNQPNNINPSSLENVQVKDISSGVVTNLPSPCKDSSNNSEQKQMKVQLDDSKNYPAQKQEVNSNKSDILKHENGKTKNDTAQEMMHRVQTPLPCTPDGYLIKPSSSKLTVQANTVSEFSKVAASENLDKLPLANKNGVPPKTWKRSITHVYVSHLIQMHLDKEKASSHSQVIKPEETQHAHHTSRSLNVSTTLKRLETLKSNAQDEPCYAVNLDVRLPVQPSSTGMIMSAARQKMVSGNFLNLPTSTAALPGTQHVQYLHPQIAPRGPMPYPFAHLPHSRVNPAPAATLHQMQQQQQQYMCNPGYAPPRPGLTAAASSSAAMMKLHHHHQQQQQMWQFHVAHQQYQQRADAAPPGAAWHNMAAASMRPMSVLATPPVMPPQMELLCAPYQGGSRQPQQLRLI